MTAGKKRWLPDFSDNQRLLLAWPYRMDVWRDNAKPAQDVVAALACLVSQYTPVTLIVHPDYKDTLPSIIFDSCSVMFESYDDIWLRDTLPFWFSTTNQASGLSFQFDGWGGVQSAVQLDKTLAEKISLRFEREIYYSDLIAEGGAFTHNGQGDCLVGLSSIKQRNAGLSTEMLKRQLADYLADQSLYFVEGSFLADETEGHIDNMALFLDESTLIYAAANDKDHPDYKTCEKLKEVIAALPQTLKKVAVPLPRPQRPTQNERASLEQLQTSLNRTEDLPLLCSYVNVLHTDTLVIVPEFGLPTDAEALAAIQRAVPNKTVLSFPARELVLGGGGLHCISHNLGLLGDDQTLTS